jgi:hypothetical protein
MGYLTTMTNANATSRKMFAVYTDAAGLPGDGGKGGGKVYVYGSPAGGVLTCKVPSILAHVNSALSGGFYPKATKPYPHAALWAQAVGFIDLCPKILSACAKVAANIGNSDGYSDDLAKVSAMFAPTALAKIVDPLKATKVLIPDAINPPEVIMIEGSRWLDITPDELQAVGAAHDAEIARKVAEKAAQAAKIAAATAAAKVASVKVAPVAAPAPMVPERFALIELD